MKKKKFDTLQNLQFTFLYADVDVDIDKSLYDDEKQETIRQIVNSCAREITVDNTYVDCKGTPYCKTFMTENGWNNFCKLVVKTKYGKKCTRLQNEIMIENYSLMILCYLYQLLEDFGYDNAGICIQLKEGSRFMSKVRTSKNIFPKYTGKWQSW